jgi:predicted nucleotidyltransferase
MNTAAPARIRKDPILAEVKKRLQTLYGARLKRVVLFGSRARGDHKQDSDYDVAVYLTGYDYTMPEVLRLADASWDVQAELGAIVSLKPFPDGSEERDTLLSREIHRDGILL